METELKIYHLTNSKKWWQFVLNKEGIAFPDSRPVYKYKLDKVLVDKALSILKCNKNLLENGNLTKYKDLCGLFVCWASEIFKREVGVASTEWVDILKKLEINIDTKQRTTLVKCGLEYLRVQIKEISGRREWLVTIQLLGGFPLNLFLNANENWLKEYFSNILSEAFKYNEKIDFNIALKITKNHEFSFSRVSYQDDIFYNLAANFIYILQNLKVEYAPNLQRNSSLVEILDRVRPDWQEALPIRIPDEKKDAIDKLLKEEIDKAARTPKNMINKIIRGIKKDGDIFESYIKFELAEEIKFNKNNKPFGEVGLYATDESANFITSQIANAEMPYDDAVDNWGVTQKLKKAIKFPLSLDVTLMWHDDNAYSVNVPNEFRGARGCSGSVLAFKPPQSDSNFYEFIGSGSIANPSEEILILVKNNAVLKHIQSGDELETGICDEIGSARINNEIYTVYKISGFFNIETDNIKYRVETNVEAKTYDIVASNIYSSKWRPKDKSINLCYGSLMLSENGVSRQPKRGELFWRNNINEKWVDYNSSKPAFGKLRVRWNDIDDGFVKSVKTIYLLPEKIEIFGNIDKSKLSVNIINAKDFNLIINDNLVKKTNDCSGYFPKEIKTTIDCELSFSDYNIPIEIYCSLKRNCFVDINGALIRGGGLRLDKLMGAYAISKNYEGILHLSIRTQGDANGVSIAYKMPKADLGGNSRLPLSHLYELIWELIGVATDPDVKIHIEFIDDDTSLDVYQFDKQLTRAEDGGVIILGNELENQKLVFRSCLEPWLEIDGIEAKELTQFGYRRILPPDEIRGASMAYTRDGDYITTRPFMACFDNTEVKSEFERICQIPEPQVRQHQLRLWFNNPDNLTEAVDVIVKTAKNLSGFPLTCMDLFKIEPPEEVLVTALINHPECREEIYNLQKELPFSWYLIKQKIWKNAFEKYKGLLFDAFNEVYQNPSIAFETVNTESRKILDFLVAKDYIFARLFEIYFPTLNKNDISNSKSKEIEYYLFKLQGKCPENIDGSPRFKNFDSVSLMGKFGGKFNPLLSKEHPYHQWFIAPFIAAEAIIDERYNLKPKDRLGIWQARKTLDYWSQKADWENDEPAQSGHAFNDALIAIIKYKLENK